jgi:sulfite reductase (NADPH) flavoprotein alpha-component
MSQNIPFIPDNAPFTAEQRAWLNGFLAGIFSTADAAPAKAPAPSLKIAVLFATQSGTSERLAKKLAKELKQQGHSAEISSLDTYSPATLAEQTHALILASTYGEGDPPDGTKSFAELILLDTAPRLDTLRYAVFALGDTSYEHFCKFGADLDARLHALGATRLCDRVDSGVDVDEPFEQWKSTAFSSLTNGPATTSAALPAAQTKAESKPHIHTRDNPYLAEVIEKRPLTHEVSSKLTVHVSISLADSAVHYEAGDACGVFAQNDPALVEEILALTQFSPDANITLPKIGTTTLLEALTHHLQPSRLTRKMLQAYTALGECPKLHNLLAPDAQKQLDEYIYDRSLIDLLEECPGVLTSPSQLIEVLPKLTTRLYSIKPRLPSRRTPHHDRRRSLSFAQPRPWWRLLHHACGAHTSGRASTYLHPAQQEISSADRQHRSHHHDRPRYRHRAVPFVPA